MPPPVPPAPPPAVLVVVAVAVVMVAPATPVLPSVVPLELVAPPLPVVLVTLLLIEPGPVEVPIDEVADVTDDMLPLVAGPMGLVPGSSFPQAASTNTLTDTTRFVIPRFVGVGRPDAMKQNYGNHSASMRRILPPS